MSMICDEFGCEGEYPNDAFPGCGEVAYWQRLEDERRDGYAAMSGVVAVYADGGVLGRNPSRDGGTWAWCHVNAEGWRVRSAAGLLLPRTHGLGDEVSNNHSEYMALAKCLRALPEGWSGKVYSDSFVTLCRFQGGSHRNVPPHWREHMEAALARLGRLEFILLDGHPTRAQLAAGIGKRGNPCSEHNVFCDRACNEQRDAFYAGREAGLLEILAPETSERRAAA